MYETNSICPLCKKILPAYIHIGDFVTITRICQEHGEYSGILEISPAWFILCKSINFKKIYDGMLVDVTNKCNISCKYCYHDNTGDHIPKEDIVSILNANQDKAPFFLTGGEPTLHPYLKEILCSSNVETWVLTNGIKLSDPEYFDDITPLLDWNGILLIGLSIHNESNGKDFKFIELCRARGKRIATVFFVIDRISQIDDCLSVYEQYSDVIYSIRIKAASNLGKEFGATNKIFVSSMVDYLLDRGFNFDTRYSNKLQYASMIKGQYEVKLISWADANNIDLNEINCPPWYITKDGRIYDLVTKCIMEQ